MSKNYITLQQLAEKLNFDERTITRLVNDGIIPYYIIGKRRRFVEEEVDESLSRYCRVMSRAEAEQKAYGKEAL